MTYTVLKAMLKPKEINQPTFICKASLEIQHTVEIN